ncbi:MAG: Zn-ribbon domain-containing OB-fold protein, partial [Candidatus Bathyarchaeota archaeon]
MTEEQPPFTIESFYNFMKKRKLMGANCANCGNLSVPPKPMCPKCFSKNLKWKELPKQGKLMTYTVIHVSPERFQLSAPYAVGIVQLENGAQLPGMIKDVDFNKIEVGIQLVVDFEKEPASDEWPKWPRHYFKP